MKGVAILSYLVVLVNACHNKEITIQGIHQIMSKTIDAAYKSWKETDPLELPHDTLSFNLKSDDLDLTMDLSNMSIYSGDLVSKSVSARLTNSAVGGEVGFILRGYKIVGKHATNGTVLGKAYNLNGDVEFKHNFERKISFGASYDNESLTVESIDRDSLVSTPSVKLTGLPFDEVIQKEITSLLRDKYVKKMTGNHEYFKNKFFREHILQLINKYEISGMTLQEVYDKTCRATAYEEMRYFVRNLIRVNNLQV